MDWFGLVWFGLVWFGSLGDIHVFVSRDDIIIGCGCDDICHVWIPVFAVL